MRLKTRWNLKDRERSVIETASAMAFTMWRIGQRAILNLENAGFQTDTNLQRLDIMEEILAFLLHVVDRSIADSLTPEDRQVIIAEIAKQLSRRVQENRADLQGSGDFRTPFIALVNTRSADLAGFSFSDGEPGYACRRYVGECVRSRMGERDNKWVTDQVMDIEVPEALKPLNRAVRDLILAAGK